MTARKIILVLYVADRRKMVVNDKAGIKTQELRYCRQDKN